MDAKARRVASMHALLQVRARVREAQRVCLFSGAGMSAESGVPTYRGQGGIWAEYRYEEYACQDAFERDPERVWAFHRLRRAAVAACSPHAGHEAIQRAAAQNGPLQVITQNIDGMHQRAGTRDVVELHGSLWRVRCEGCGVVQENHDLAMKIIRHECGGLWRPDITWFGDALDGSVFEQAVAAVESCDVFIAVGTSGVVYPAAGLPELAMQSGAWLVEVNPEMTSLTHLYDLHLPLKASEALVHIFNLEQ